MEDNQERPDEPNSNDHGRVIECEECEHSYDQLDGDGHGLCGYCAGRAFELPRTDEE